MTKQIKKNVMTVAFSGVIFSQAALVVFAANMG